MGNNQISRTVSSITRRGAVALLVAILSVGLLIGAGSRVQKPEGVRVEFSQLNWKGPDKSVRFPQSRVGVAELSFAPEAANLLTKSGGFVNIVIRVPGGKPAEWAVRNLFVRYSSEDRMLKSSPTVQFDLTTPNGQRVRRLSYILSVTEKPQAAAPAGRFIVAPVGLESYQVGGRKGGGSELSNLPLRIKAWQGVRYDKDLVDAERREAETRFAVTDLPEVDEDVNGCAPASVARSIQYMLDAAGLESPSVQDIYDDLYDNMGTTEEGGTQDEDMVSGKAEYAEDNDLDIETDLTYGLGDIGDAMDTLDNDGDVEILISWDGGGGHAAMIISIVDNGDGTYQITYIDDPDQGDGVAENEEHVITVNADGTFDGGTVDGFLIENLTVPTSTPTPTPSPYPSPYPSPSPTPGPTPGPTPTSGVIL